MFQVYKVGCVFSMVVVSIESILPHGEFGRNDHREDVPHFIVWLKLVLEQDYLSYENLGYFLAFLE